MRKMVVTVAAVLVLSGCAADTPEVETVEESPAVEEITPAPLESQQEPVAEPDSPEAAYLQLIREYADRGPEIADASDEQLIAAGMLACEQLADGIPEEDVVVVEGEQRYDATGLYPVSTPIMMTARDHLC